MYFGHPGIQISFSFLPSFNLKKNCIIEFLLFIKIKFHFFSLKVSSGCLLIFFSPDKLYLAFEFRVESFAKRINLRLNSHQLLKTSKTEVKEREDFPYLQEI